MCIFNSRVKSSGPQNLPAGLKNLFSFLRIVRTTMFILARSCKNCHYWEIFIFPTVLVQRFSQEKQNEAYNFDISSKIFKNNNNNHPSSLYTQHYSLIVFIFAPWLITSDRTLKPTACWERHFYCTQDGYLAQKNCISQIDISYLEYRLK